MDLSLLLSLLLAQDPAAAAKAAADLLAAQDVLTMWKAIAVLSASAAAFCFYKWQKGLADELAETKAALAIYQTKNGGAS